MHIWTLIKLSWDEVDEKEEQAEVMHVVRQFQEIGLELQKMKENMFEELFLEQKVER